MVELPGFIDICTLGVHIGEFADEWGIAVVAGLFECCRFDLANNANFVAGGNKAFDVDV